MRYVEPEFDFKAESVLVEYPLPSPSMRHQIAPPSVGLRIELVHRPTGRVAQTTLRRFSVDHPAAMQRVVQRLILQEFGDTDAARMIRQEHHQIPVAIKPTENLAEMIGEGFHVALRKFTEGPASVLWWNLIYRMPSPLYRLLRGKTAFDLAVYESKVRELGRAMQLNACITVSKGAWESTLDLARLYFDKSREASFVDDLRRSRAHVFEGAPWPDRADLTFQQADALFQASQDAYTALDLLTPADWASMLWTVVDEAGVDEDLKPVECVATTQNTSDGARP